MVVAWGIVIVFGLDDLAVAAIGLAVVAAAVPLANLAFNLTRQLPWPIYLAADLIVRVTEDVILGTVQWTEAAAQGLADVIQLPWQAIWTVARASIQASEELYWSVWRVFYVEVPAVFGWAQQAILGAELAAFQHADALAAQETAYAQQLAAGAIARADAEWVSAIEHADQLAGQESAYAQQLWADAVGRADREWASAIEHADQVGAAAVGYSQTLWADAVNLEQLIAHQLELDIERVEQAGTDYTRQAFGDLAQDLAAGIATAEAFAAATVAVVSARVQELEDSPCQRFCGPLGDLGGLLQGLEAAGIGALALALLAEARSDPGGLERAIASVVVPAARDVGRSLSLGIPG